MRLPTMEEFEDLTKDEQKVVIKTNIEILKRDSSRLFGRNDRPDDYTFAYNRDSVNEYLDLLNIFLDE